MSFARARSQVLTRYMPGALFVHDAYGVCQVTAVDLDPVDGINDVALGEALREYLGQWDAPLRAGYVLDLTVDLRRLFIIGAPARVRFAPYPELLQCTRCAQVAPLARLRGGPPGVCPACGGGMRQIPFVESHACGRLEPLSTPLCPVHGATDLVLETTGRYRSVIWRCRACGDAFLAGVRNRSCMCEVTRRQPPTAKAARLMRGTIVTDTALHMVHTTAFLNLPPHAVDAVLRDPDGRLLALARSCGALDVPVTAALAARDGDARVAPAVQELITALCAEGIDRTALEAAVRRTQARPSAAETALTALEAAFGVRRSVLQGRVSRRVVDYAALRDSGAVRPLAAIRADLAAVDDADAVAALDTGAALATQLGVASVATLDAFPLALAAVGYSRLQAKPNACAVVPFALPNEARVPLYVLANVTEAITLQLDPARVLAWLAANGLVRPSAPVDPLATWAMLHTAVPALLQGHPQPDEADPAAEAVRTLLHTVSHSLLQAIALSGYAPESVGELLYPETLAVVLYANRFTDTKIGGLLTLVERSLAAWLTQARDASRTCLHDPVCTDSGGACAACLHRQYGCPHGNRELSRAALWGGPAVVRGFWEGVR